MTIPLCCVGRRRRECPSDENRRLYQRHRWRTESFYGEAKTCMGLGALSNPPDSPT
jgi:hypothetical protein